MIDKLVNSFKSKTALFAMLLTIAGIVQQNTEVITKLIGEHNTGVLMSGVGVVVYILRWITTAPLEEK
jgi:hypothetical protein